jgi:DNA-binding transcriptional ArsR family regulator
MTMTKSDGVETSGRRPRELDGLVAAACLFHGFSDPSRIAILQHLATGDHRVVDLTAHIGLAQSTVSKHLACLRDCGLVSARPEGRATVYSLNHAETLMDLWAAAEQLLALTGDSVALCANYGIATLATTETA